ncbi:MAG: hypothetical protein RL653_1966 [Pseudomonadota bacterium]
MSTLPAEVSELARRSGMRLRALHGSRAREDHRPDSDWDFAFVPGPSTDELALGAALVRLLGTDAVDLCRLDTAGGLLRFRVAREGVLLFESAPGTWASFVFEAARFWAEAGPILSRGLRAYADSLERGEGAGG